MKKLNPDLEHYLQQLLGNEFNDFLEARPEPTAIRVNTLKTEISAVQEKLTDWGFSFSRHPANPSGLILQNEPLPLSHTLEHFLGEFYYQGIASQLPVLALNPQPGETVLDMSASPGSKSTQIAAMMQNTGRLVLNDPSIYRHRALTANTLKAGILNDVTVRVPGQRLGRLFPGYFDKVLVDAPCSGLGTFPSFPNEINTWWTVEKLEKFTHIQHQLLVSAIKAVKPGGSIVYSTCSISPEENELVIDRIVRKYPVQIEKISELHSVRYRPGLTEYGKHKLNSQLKHAIKTSPLNEPIEGFFMVKLKKTAPMPAHRSDHSMDFIPISEATEHRTQIFLEQIERRWGIPRGAFEDFHFVFTQKRVWIFRKSWDRIPAKFLVKAGILLAEKGYGCWKLSHSSVYLFRDYISKSFLELKENQMQSLFRDGKIHHQCDQDDYYILLHQGRKIGIVSLFNNILKINLPQQFNLVP